MQKGNKNETKPDKKKVSIASFFLRRYIASLIFVSFITTGVIYWLLYSVQTDAIELSLESTEEFLSGSLRHQVRNYEFESLQQSLKIFREKLEFRRIEVVGPYGIAIAEAGDALSDLAPDRTMKIYSDAGAEHGEIRIWYSQSQHAWAQSRESAYGVRILASLAFFTMLAVGSSLFFFYLIRRHFEQPLDAMVTHMTASQEQLQERSARAVDVPHNQPLPLPEYLTHFRETHALGGAYSRLETRWIESDQARVAALSNERYQRSILLKVLQIAKITVVYLDDDEKVVFVGTPLQKSIMDLFQATKLDKDLITANAENYDLNTQKMVFKGAHSNYTLNVELEDKNGCKWSLHQAIIDSKHAVILREVTQERGLEQALLRNEKLKAVGTLSSSIAHDFNNVIASILVNMELIKEMTIAGETVPLDLFEGIETSTASVSGRIRGIRRLVEDDQLNLKAVDQNARLKDLKLFIAPSLGTNINLKFELQDSSPIVCDGNEFESCIINLLVNAKQAMNGRGSITLPTRAADERDLQHAQLKPQKMLAIDVEDTGVGVPIEISNLIFDPFYSTKKLSDGTGLGLAQVQAFCTRAGGGVYLDRHRKKGAAFTLLLPKSVEMQTSKAVGKPISEFSTQEFVVHILDDNALLAKSTAKMLDRYGFVTQVHITLDQLRASASQAALTGILLSDVHMPDCNIKDVMDFAKSQGPQLQLAFYSGNEESIAAINRQYPKLPTLLKPFKFDELVELLVKMDPSDKRAKGNLEKTSSPQNRSRLH